MSKKIGCALLVLLLVFVCVYGCAGGGIGPRDTKATVDGKMISANEIIKEIDGSPTEFYYNYAEKEVKVTGTVESVKIAYITMFSQNVKVYKVFLQEGWVAHLEFSDNPKIANLKPGDKVTIVSRMSVYDGSVGYIEIENIGITSIGGVRTYTDNSIVTIH